jgi:hypothetical protein
VRAFNLPCTTNNSDTLQQIILKATVFRFEELGFEEVEDDFYKVFFREVEIGEFDVEALRFRPALMALYRDRTKQSSRPCTSQSVAKYCFATQAKRCGVSAVIASENVWPAA